MYSIYFAGDSITAGALRQPDGAYIITQENEVTQCAKLLTQEYGDKVKCTNLGVGGTFIGEWYYGSPAVPLSLAQRLANKGDMTHLVLQIGMNDCYSSDPLVGQLADWNWYLTQFNANCQAAGVKFIIATTNPCTNGHNTRLWELQNQMKITAAQLGAPVIDHYSTVIASTPNWGAAFPDGAHPGLGAYAFKGGTSYMALRGILGAP